MIQLSKVDLKEIELLRLDYLESLPEFQELFLELLVKDSECYCIMVDEVPIGYAIKTSDNILVEFYIIDSYVPECMSYFKMIVNELSIQKVYCKSFDFLLLNCCLINFSSYHLEGTLFRDYFITLKYQTDDLSVRTVNDSDLPLLLQQHDGLYETPQELEYFVKNKNIILFHKDDQLIGCGYLIRIHEKWNYFDIGMWVKTDFRKQGYATKIISYLKETCLNNNWIPICGCAYDNTTSQKTLEKNGFISKHKLLAFSIISS